MVDRGDQLAEADTINFDGKQRSYVLTGNARFADTDRKASADRISYDETTDVTILTGNASYVGEKQQITGDYIYYDAAREVYRTRGRSFVSLNCWRQMQLILRNSAEWDKLWVM